jgi:drug/metabolite transporter (DMT)-like permease
MDRAEEPLRGRWTASLYVLALVPILLWGSSFIAVKIALREVSPLGVVALRGVLGLAALGVVLAVLRPPRTGNERKGDGRRMVFLGLLGVVVQTGLQAFALRLTSAQNAGWLVTLIPIFTGILSALFLRERFPPLKLAGVALGFSGALVVTLSGSGGGSFALPSTRGDLLMLLSAFNWAVYTLIARGLFQRRGALRATVRILSAGTVGAVLLYLATGRLAEVSWTGWAALAFLGVGCTGIAFLAWARALEILEPGTLTTFQYVQPIVTVFVAASVLGEAIRPGALAGGFVAVFGVALVQGARYNRPSVPFGGPR